MKKYLSILMIVLLAVFASCSNDDDDKTLYTVTFETDGGSPVPSVQRVEEGSTATAPTTNPTKAGYTFVFWHLSGVTTAYNFQTTVNSNITLHAKWQEEATAEYWQVSWNLNSGAWPSDDNHATQVLKGGTLAEPTAPIKSGNTFEGWYKESALTNKVTFPYDVSNVTSDFTLYAKWTNEDGNTDPSGYKMFTSISALKSWLISQPDNTVETPYKVGLKNVNLDTNNGWGDLGLAIYIYVDLNLSGCTGTTIPDGYQERVNVGVGKWELRTYGAFAGNSHIVSITSPKGLKTVGKWTFYKCSNLNSVTLSEELTDINDYAFEDCSKLSSINLPDGLKKLGYGSFQYSGLTSVTIPGSVNSFDSQIFYRCESMLSVVINEGIKELNGKNMFQYCYSLKSVTLPKSLESLGNGVFRSCDFKEISLPEGIVSIGEDAFRATGLSSVILPKTLKVIGDNAFNNCISLKTVTSHPITPPALGQDAFKDIHSDALIKVPSTSLNAYKTASEWSTYSDKIVANTN